VNRVPIVIEPEAKSDIRRSGTTTELAANYEGGVAVLEAIHLCRDSF
jgi:hypothetical protein